MADDITLTVRVRDLTQGQFDRMNQRLARMRNNLNQVGGSGRNASIHTTRLGRDVDRLGQSFVRMRNEGTLTRTELTRMRDTLRGMGRDAQHSFRAGDITRSQFRNIRSEIRGMDREFRRLGGSNRSFFGRMRDGLTSLRNSLKSSGRAVRIFLLILLLIGPAAQLVGALLITALAASFIALGAYALRGSAQVKSAFTDMKSTIGGVVRDAAKPMEGALVEGMHQIANAAIGLKPLLTQAFQATAPLVKDVTGAVTDFAAGALPGMVAALQSAGPAMQGFRNAMGDLGLGFGNMFKNMAAGNEKGLAEAWALVGEELQNFLQNLGTFIADMSRSASASSLFIGIMRAFSGVLHIVDAAFQAIDSVASPLFGKINDWVQGMSGLTGVSKQVAASFDYIGLSSAQLHTKLDDVNKKIKDIQDTYANMPGPAKKHYMDKSGYSGLVAQRKALEDALAAKADTSSAANDRETKSIKDLINATRQLNEANRNNLDARANMEQAIDDAQKGYKKYHGALKMVGGQLELNKKSERDAYNLLSQISSATNDATQKAQDSHRPWSEINAEWKRGHDSIVALAHGMGLSKTEAEGLAEQLLNMPDAKVTFRMNKADATADLTSFNAALKATPKAHSVTLSALSASGEQILKAFGLKVKRLPNGKVTISAAAGRALSAIADIAAAVNGLPKQANIGIGIYKTTYLNTVQMPGTAINGKKYPGVTPNAKGGLIRRFADGGGAVSGPGSESSDSIPALLSDGEYVVRASAVRKYGHSFLEAINRGSLRPEGFARFARGGHLSRAQRKAQDRAKAVAQAEHDARGQMSGQFGISFFGKIAGYQHTPYEVNTGKPQSLGDLVSALNGLRSQIKAAFHGRQESSLLNRLTSAGKALIKYEKKLGDVNKKLDAAKTKLNDLKDAAASLRDSVSSGVLSATDITKVASGSDKNITMTDVMAQMRQNVDKSSAFAKSLGDLRSRGVSKDIINQIAQAGIEGGGLETATAILSGSSSDIAALNQMQSQINAAAKNAGKMAADSMYGAGLKAAEGLVKGLTKKQKDIENAMMRIAKSMEKALKHALGIRSPSKVTEKIGHFTAEGFAVGVRKNRNAQSAWSSMLNVSKSPASSVSGGVGGGGGGTYVIPVYIGGQKFEEIILDTNRRVVRKRGGDVQKVFGK